MLEHRDATDVAREVIPFRERRQDIALWVFFLVNVIFVTYQADIEQLVIRDPDNFSYPIWPPAYMIDFLHWYFANYDPLLYERPVWYTTIVVIDQVVYGPFYIAALYAFWKGKEWIRNWSIIWASVIALRASGSNSPTSSGTVGPATPPAGRCWATGSRTSS